MGFFEEAFVVIASDLHQGIDLGDDGLDGSGVGERDFPAAVSSLIDLWKRFPFKVSVFRYSLLLFIIC